MAARSTAQAAESGAGAATTTAVDPRRWLILAVICIAFLMVGIDITVMNLALPSAQKALAFTTADRQWIVTAYALSFGSLLLFSGRLADLVGCKTTFLIGLIGFAAASAVGGAAGNFGTLVTARACQGVFAALLAPATLALLTTTFTDPKERGKAFGAFGAVAASGAGLGLLLGGVLTSGLSWRWCMYVNVVFAGIAAVGGALLLGRQPTRRGARLDIPGVLLVSAGMFLVVFGFASAAKHGWHAPSCWISLAAGGVLLALFVGWQFQTSQPLLPPRIVLDRNRGGAYLTMLIVGIGIFGVFLFLMYYLQTDLRFSAIMSGVALLPMVVFTAVGSTVGNIVLMPRFGPRPLMTAGLLLAAAGMAWLTRIDAHASYASALLGPIMVVGLGVGLVFSAALRTGTSGVATGDAGIASASVSTGQQLGGAIGTALLNTIAASATTSYLADHATGRPTPELVHVATIHGYTTVFWWCTAIFATGAVLAALLLRSGPLPPPLFGPGAKAAEPAEAA